MRKGYNMDKWINKYNDPGAEYRAHPFWSWNDDLEEEELRRQIRLIAESGQGGFFMHARDGLDTGYLDDNWFKMVNVCADEAKKCGIEAWCYDEYGWPSGSAGGVIQELKYENNQFVLRCLPLKNGEKTRGDLLGFYGVNEDLTYERILADNVEDAFAGLKDGQKLYYGTALAVDEYIDVLNPAVVKDFIDYTHGQYHSSNPTAFESGLLKGFFTDEAQYTLCKTPWTMVADEEFSKRYGYDVRDHIPALFLQTPNKEAVRYDYWRMISNLFTESFMKQIYDWCDEHKTKLTGHVMMEDNLLCQIHCTAGAMPSYEYMHIPGVDWLGRGTAPSKIDKREGIPIVPLQVGSVAAQLGKKQVLTETYAMSGWDASFNEFRHLADWQYLSGVNYMCQHLAGYSMRGRRKNDYPPSMFYQSPFWKEYKTFMDYLARLGNILSDGADKTDVMMIHPMQSIWIKYTNDDLCGEDAFDTAFMETSLKLYEYHIPYHFGDETLIRRHGRVENGKFIIGNCSYSTVLLPWLYGLDRYTCELLNEFVDQGGRLALICDPAKTPEFIEGRYAKDELDALIAKAQKADINNEEVFTRFISENGLDKVTISERNGICKCIHYNVKTYDDGRKAYFFVNMDRENAHRVKITLNEAEAKELLVDRMEYVSHPSVIRDGKLELEVIFEPIESHLFVVGAEGEAPLAERYREAITTRLGSKWKISKASDPNCLLLEYCNVLANDGTWSAPMHHYLSAQRAFGVRQTPPALRYTVNIGDDADIESFGDVRLVSEFRLPVTFTVNGTVVEHACGEWWFDHGFKVYHIGGLLKKGTNEIVVTDLCTETPVDGGVRYSNRAEYGNMYLVGNFGVLSNKPYIEATKKCVYTDGEFVLGNRPTELLGGELVRQGHPFFAGTVVLEQDVDVDNVDVERHIKLASPYAAYAIVSVNGNRGKLMSWNGFEMDITPFVTKGKNHIEVELAIGNRNLLGPHHLQVLEEQGSGPGDFYPFEPSKWQKRYSFVKAGLDE